MWTSAACVFCGQLHMKPSPEALVHVVRIPSLSMASQLITLICISNVISGMQNNKSAQLGIVYWVTRDSFLFQLISSLTSTPMALMNGSQSAVHAVTQLPTSSSSSDSLRGVQMAATVLIFLVRDLWWLLSDTHFTWSHRAANFY